MDFTLSPESKMMIKAAREFARQVIEPIAAKMEEEDVLPDDLLPKFAGAKMLGMTVPREYGGTQTTALNMILVSEELAKGASAAYWVMAMNNSVAETIHHWGSEEQRRRFLPPLCDGSHYASMAFTEPGTGSDPTAITMTAVPDGDDYVLNGTKRFITNGHKVGHGVFFAKDETSKVTAFLVDKSAGGYSCSKPWALMGLGGQGLVDVFLKDVKVPKAHILGEKSKGFRLLLRWIAGERVQQMVFMVGMGQACLDESLKYGKERMVRGKPMTAMQGFQWMLSEMHASIEACRWWTYRIAGKQDEGDDIQVDSAALKLFVVPAIQEVARKALQFHGPYGYCKGYKIEKLYRAIAHGGVTALLIGEGVADQVEELVCHGADRVILADDPVAKDYRTEVYTGTLVEQVLKTKPEILLIGATRQGRDLAPRVAARLNTGCSSDCTELDIDPETRLLVATKPFIGNNVMADMICPLFRPQMVTVRPGVFELEGKDRARRGKLIHAAVNFKEEDVKVRVIKIVRTPSKGAGLERAEKVVAGGMGIGDAGGFEMLKELAHLLGAELGATSLPIEAGWLPRECKIGQIGKTVRPRLYLACGISGAVQHTAGIVNSEAIVAINKDPKAEIFDVADYGIVDDLKRVVPAIIDELKKRVGKRLH